MNAGTFPRCAAVLLGSTLLAPAAAATSELTVDAMAGAGWSSGPLRLTVDLAAVEGPAVALQIEHLSLPPPLGELRDITLTCASVALSAAAAVCRHVDVRLAAHGTPVAFSGSLRYVAHDRQLFVDIPAIELAGARIGASIEAGRQGFTLAASGVDVTLAALVEWLKPAVTVMDEIEVVDGSASFRVEWRTAGDGQPRLRAEADIQGLEFSDASGRAAGEAIDAAIRIEDGGPAEDASWQGDIRLAITAGGVYVEPVFVDFSAYPLQLEAAAAFGGAAERLRLSSFQLEQRGLARAHGHLFASAAHWLDEVSVTLENARFPATYDAYLKGTLVGTPFANLDTSGTASGQLDLRRGRPATVAFAFDDINLEDRDGRFALYGAHGTVYWQDAGGSPAPSEVGFSGGFLHGAGFDAGVLRLALAGDAIDLLEPVRVPLLGGAMRIETFNVRDWDSAAVTVGFEAELEPIELRQLTMALGWPAFSGTLSGRLPRLTYSDGVVALGGTLEAQAFDGDIRIDKLSIEQPFGIVPALSTTVRLRNLDLARLTEVYSFGQISGRLDGDIENLVMLKGEPVSFDARFRTPADDDSRHRISQQAVGTISRVAGGSSSVLSSTFLGVFKHFAYDRLGLSCRLDNDVCHMDGIEPADDGYYIVKGSLLPRLDLIGRVREVQWTRLTSQLKQALAEGKLEVR